MLFEPIWFKSGDFFYRRIIIKLGNAILSVDAVGLLAEETEHSGSLNIDTHVTTSMCFWHIIKLSFGPYTLYTFDFIIRKRYIGFFAENFIMNFTGIIKKDC